MGVVIIALLELCGAVLAVLTLVLLMFAVSTPLVLAFSVARYQEPLTVQAPAPPGLKPCARPRRRPCGVVQP